MAKLKIKVTVPIAQWAYSDIEPPLQLAGGEHDLELSDRGDDLKTLRALGAAHAAGTISIKGSREAINKALAHVEGEDEARARILDLERDVGYQAELDLIRNDVRAPMSANHQRVVDALERSTTDPDDGDVRDELDAALQEKTDLESRYHHAIAELRS